MLTTSNKAVTNTLDAATNAKVYCENHPKVETLLHCNQCGRSMCLRCLQHMETGYRCNKCAFRTERSLDYLVVFSTGFGISLLAVPLVALIMDTVVGYGFLYAIFLIVATTGPGLGSRLADIIRASVKRRRSRHRHHFSLAGIIGGVVTGITVTYLLTLTGSLALLAVLAYSLLIATATYRDLSGG